MPARLLPDDQVLWPSHLAGGRNAERWLDGFPACHNPPLAAIPGDDPLRRRGPRRSRSPRGSLSRQLQRMTRHECFPWCRAGRLPEESFTSWEPFSRGYGLRVSFAMDVPGCNDVQIARALLDSRDSSGEERFRCGLMLGHDGSWMLLIASTRLQGMRRRDRR